MALRRGNLNVFSFDFAGTQAGHLLVVAEDHGNGGSHRHSQEGADDAGQGGADRDGEQHHCRVQAHGLGLQHRLEDVALHLLDDDDESQGEQGLRQPIGDQRDDDGQSARSDSANDRDEAGEERNYADDKGQRYLENPEAEADEDAVDGILIGLGLWVLQVPLALVIGVVTFFASFIPVIGAVTAGALAVIIALVSDGLTKALLALALIIIVQQVEGNVLQPMLQSKAMGLHAAMVLLSVTVGSALAGIIGAFLAVPVAATIAVVFRYHQEMASLRAGEIEAKNIKISTAEGHEDVMELYENLEASGAR